MEHLILDRPDEAAQVMSDHILNSMEVVVNMLRSLNE